MWSSEKIQNNRSQTLSSKESYQIFYALCHILNYVFHHVPEHQFPKWKGLLHIIQVFYEWFSAFQLYLVISIYCKFCANAFGDECKCEVEWWEDRNVCTATSKSSFLFEEQTHSVGNHRGLRHTPPVDGSDWLMEYWPWPSELEGKA